MKKKIIALMLCLISILISNLKAQDITEVWNGVLEVMGTQLALVFHIHETDSGFTANFDSPDQGALGIPFTTVEFNNDKLILSASNIGAFYEGIPAADSIAGTWIQGGQSLELRVSAYGDPLGSRMDIRSQVEVIAQNWSRLSIDMAYYSVKEDREARPEVQVPI